MTAKLKSLINQGINAIIRPPRRTYDPSDMPVYYEAEDDMKFIRNPVNFDNQRGQKMIGSLYTNADRNIMQGGPCIIYMHGNASSQHEGQFLVPNFCPLGIAVYCFDFAGCGASGGEFISLGHFETIDMNYLMEMLSMTFDMGPFVVWGRSMGAATGLMCNHPKLIGRVIDSAYTSIPDMCTAIAKQFGMPAFFTKAVVWWLKGHISDKANFDLYSVTPLTEVKKANKIPLIMCHAEDDEFVPFEQGKTLFEAYSNPEKQLIVVKGGHNGRRGDDWLSPAMQFAFRWFGLRVRNFLPNRCGLDSAIEQHFSSFEELVKFSNEHGYTNNQIIGSLENVNKNNEKKGEVEQALQELTPEQLKQLTTDDNDNDVPDLIDF